MHGVGKLMPQARALGQAQADAVLAPSQAQLANEYQRAQADLAALLSRCDAAERRVARCVSVVIAFEKQMEPLPADHSARVLGEQIINTFKEVLK